MNTVAEIEASLPELSTPELRRIEKTIRGLYRKRNAPVLYDDLYGVWTEDDQTAAASMVFEVFEEEESGDDHADP